MMMMPRMKMIYGEYKDGDSDDLSPLAIFWGNHYHMMVKIVMGRSYLEKLYFVTLSSGVGEIKKVDGSLILHRNVKSFYES